MKKGLMRALALSASAAMVALDQLFKYLAKVHLSGVTTLPLIEDVFHLTYVENRGAAFGMLSGKTIFLVGLTALALVALIVAILIGKIQKNWMLWSFSLIIGGGIGNLIVRVSRQYVIDYLDVRLIHFAVFNFADCCVVIGTVLVFLFVLYEVIQERKLEKAGDSDA